MRAGDRSERATTAPHVGILARELGTPEHWVVGFTRRLYPGYDVVSGMTDQDPRRRHQRIDTQQRVWVEGQNVRVPAETRNISKGGMFVVAEGNAPEIGTKLQIQFHDPLEGAIDVKMEVVWRDEKTVTAKLGLRAVDSRGMAAFERVVSRYEAEQDEPETTRRGPEDETK